jgi:gamma-glutamyltranspeptidase / glutathione hydrolase
MRAFDLPGRSPVIAENGMAATSHPLATQSAIDILKAGGNAVDAIVGTVFCVGVTNMYHCGIGGGGFAVLRTPDGEYETVDFREKAPAKAFEEMYKDNEDASIYGGLARYDTFPASFGQAQRVN